MCVVYSEILLREIGENTPLHELWIPTDRDPPKGLKPERVIRTTPEIIRKVTGLESATDVLGVVRLPPQQELKGERLLLLDEIADPGNLGALIRSALALGWDGVYIAQGSVDPFNDKAIRASRGALFHLPYQKGSLERALASFPNHRLLVADARGGEGGTKGAILLALGNEAGGPSPLLLEQGELIGIPISPKMESLNVAVAGGILLYRLGSYGRG